MASLWVLAGANGAGKSSVGGATFRQCGADYFNLDEAARRLEAAIPRLTARAANGAAWLAGKRLLEKAIATRSDHALETTFGGSEITLLIGEAAAKGVEVHIWFVGLHDPELHLARVRARVAKGGHDVREPDVRRRYDASRLNLISLLPRLTGLRVFDNSAEGDPDAGVPPRPVLVLHLAQGRILGPRDLSKTPGWAKPIVAAALSY